MAGDVAGPDVPKLILLGLALGVGEQFVERFIRQRGIDDQTSGGPSTIMPIMAKSSMAL